MPTLLDDDRLSAFELRLTRVGAAIVDQWAPGVPDSRIDELLGPLDIDLPGEARVWWGRHNGAAAGASRARTMVLPARQALSLEQAVDACLSFCQMGDELYGMPEADKHLPLLGGRPDVFLDCNGGRDAPASVYSQNDPTDPPRLVLASLGELVTIWTELLDSGAFVTNPDGTWLWAPERIPQSIRALGIC